MVFVKLITNSVCSGRCPLPGRGGVGGGAMSSSAERNRKLRSDPVYREREREYERERYRSDPEFRERVRERVRERKRERYRSDPEFRARHKAEVLAFRKRPEVRRKHAVRMATLRAAGRAEVQLDLFDDVRKPQACQLCGVAGERIEAHHPDYRLPLSIEWLCKRCHGMRHWRY